MSSMPPAGVRWAKPAWHPALAAWREVAPHAADPGAVEVLHESQKSATYRLAGTGPAGAPLIAQRSMMAKAMIERTVYDQILPQLPVTSPRYYGFRAESPEFAWLFLEDVGDEPYSVKNHEHRALAGGWVARMHGAATSVVAARRLPDGGPARYLDHLRAARGSIRANLTNRALTPDDVAMLERLAAELDRLETEWPRIECACAGAPTTLTHGDFRPKNALIRSDGQRLRLFPIDWELAGWGVPAADLTRIDLPSYWSVARAFWPDLRFEDVHRLACAGQVFQWLAATRWDADQLVYEAALCLSKPLASLRVVHTRLNDALRALGEAAA